MEPGADLHNNLVREVSGCQSRFLGWNAVSYAIEEGTRIHVTGAGQVLGLGRE